MGSFLWFKSKWKTIYKKRDCNVHTCNTEAFISLGKRTYSWNSSLWKQNPRGIQSLCSLPIFVVTLILCRTCSSDFYTKFNMNTMVVIYMYLLKGLNWKIQCHRPINIIMIFAQLKTLWCMFTLFCLITATNTNLQQLHIENG